LTDAIILAVSTAAPSLRKSANSFADATAEFARVAAAHAKAIGEGREVGAVGGLKATRLGEDH
jgi:hypothetical protein